MSPPKILVVDDEPEVLVALDDLLVGSYRVLQASSGESALRIARDERDIAVVVTDQRMADMTGTELLARLEPTCRAERILLTGFADVRTIAQAINEARIFAYVTKPWQSLDLRTKVASAAERYAMCVELEHERQLMADLMNNTPDGVAFRGDDGRIERANRAFAAMLGHDDPGALIGRTIQSVVGQREAEKWARQDQQVLDSGRPIADVIRCYGVPDARCWISETVVPIKNTSGGVVGLVNVTKDVTQRLQVEQALRENQRSLIEKTQLLDSVLHAMEDAVVVAARSGELVYKNRSATALLDVAHRENAKSPETLGSWTQELRLSPHEDGLTSSESDPLQRALQGERGPPVELVMTRTGQPDAIYSVWAAPIDDADGQPQGALALLRDVTLQRQVERQLLQSQKLEALGQLAGGIAHDFGNLLAVVQNYAHLLRKGIEPEHPVQADIAEVLDATRRATHLTRQLLVFGRRRVTTPAVTDANSVVERMQRVLARIIGKRVELKTDLAPNAPAVALDEGLLEQIIMSLVINARDAVRGTGRIVVSTRHQHEGLAGTPGGALLLTVEHDGKGMTTDAQARIFDPFHTTKDSGTDLGLASMYGIVREAGGTVDVESKLGEGASFTLHLPAAQDTPRSDVSMSEPKRATVLLVEPDAALRARISRLLAERGCQVLVADTAEHARRLCREALRVDVVITDIAMPSSSGPELVRELRQLDAQVRVVFMTDEATPRALDLSGADDLGILRKPFTPEQLETRLCSVLSAAT